MEPQVRRSTIAYVLIAIAVIAYPFLRSRSANAARVPPLDNPVSRHLLPHRPPGALDGRLAVTAVRDELIRVAAPAPDLPDRSGG